MLVAKQQKVLEALILSKLPNNPSLDTIAIFVDYDIARNMPVFTHTGQISKWIVEQALSQPSPEPLIRLVRTADNGDGRLDSIIKLINQLASDPEPWVRWAREQRLDGSMGEDPLFVENGGPFINRSTFRNIIPREGALETPSCILVEGALGSGKSYLYDYCKRLASHWQNFNLGCTTVGSSSAGKFDPETAAVELAVGLGTDFNRIPRVHEDPHRYARNLVVWITECTPVRRLPSITIFDGFDAQGITDPVRTFIEELIRSIQGDEQLKQRYRVLLLGYDAYRLERNKLKYKRYVLEHVGVSHIEEWFRKRYPNQPKYRYEDTAKMIEQRLPPSGEMRLRQLCNLVRVASAGFQGGN